MTIPYSAGMVPRGAFYMPPGMRYGMGGNEDPLAALIGNALGTYSSVTEKQKSDALQAQKEKDDATRWNTTAAIDAYRAGLAPIQPQPNDPGTADAGVQQALGTDALDRTPRPGQTPVMTIGGVPYGRDVGRELGKGQFILPGPAGGDILYGDPGTGTVTDTGVARPGDVPKAPGYHIEFSDDGSGTGRQVGKWVSDAPTAGTPQTVPGLVHQAADQNKPTPHQRDTAEFGAGALAAFQQVDKIRQQNPGVEEEVGRILTTPQFVQAIPGFKSAADMASALQKAGASPAAQTYMRAKWSEMDNVIRTRIPGGRMSGALFTQMGNEFLPALDAQANGQIRTNELQAIATAQGEAGFDDNPDIWNAAAKRHGVGGVNVGDLLSGGSGDNRLNDIRKRYK